MKLGLKVRYHNFCRQIHEGQQQRLKLGHFFNFFFWRLFYWYYVPTNYAQHKLKDTVFTTPLKMGWLDVFPSIIRQKCQCTTTFLVKSHFKVSLVEFSVYLIIFIRVSNTLIPTLIHPGAFNIIGRNLVQTNLKRSEKQCWSGWIIRCPICITFCFQGNIGSSLLGPGIFGSLSLSLYLLWWMTSCDIEVSWKQLIYSL